MDKEWYKSKTIWTGAAILVCGVLKLFGVEVDTITILSLLGLEGMFLRSGQSKTLV